MPTQLLPVQVEGVPTIGFVTWWNVRDVEISRDWFKAELDKVGLDGDRYAKDHNYRATFIRCLRHLEQQRIIRRVTEDQDRLVYQFTAETLIDDPDNPRLEYTPETVIEIDKDAYWTTNDFAESLVKCDETLKVLLVDLFEKERQTYRSSDLTRYVQKIFRDHADIVSLREQGSVYFVPAAYQELVNQVSQVLAAITTGQAQLEFFPVPDVESSRNMVGHGVEAEIAEVFAKMEAEIKEMQSGSNNITDKWVQHRRAKIQAIKERLNAYSLVLGDTADKLHGQFDSLKVFLKPRTIEI